MSDDADVQRVQDWWSGRICGLQAAEKRVKMIIRNYEHALKEKPSTEIEYAATGAVATLKMLLRDLKHMQKPPKA